MRHNFRHTEAQLQLFQNKLPSWMQKPLIRWRLVSFY